MKKATIMNRIRKAKQAGDTEGEARLRDQLAQYQQERKARHGLRRTTYRVKRGDNYFSIAEDIYGDARYAIRLAKANKGLYQLSQGMVLQLPPKDEEEPLITNEEWADVLEAEEERAAGVDTTWEQEPPAMPDRQAQAVQPGVPDTQQTGSQDEIGIGLAPEESADGQTQKTAMVDDSGSAGDGSSELDLQTLGTLPIDLNPYHIGSLDMQGIEKWKQEYPEEVEEYVDKAVDYYAKILWPGGQQGAGGISKNSPLLQTVPVSLTGGEGDEPEPTPTPEDEYTRSEKASIARWYADAAKYYADIGDAEKAKYYGQLMQAWDDGKGHIEMEVEQTEIPEQIETPTTTQDENKEPTVINYVIKSGDTLTQIALENNVTLKEVMDINGIEDENKIIAGQELVVPQRLGENAIMPEVISAGGAEFIKGEETINDQFEAYLYDDLGPGKGNCTIGYGYQVHAGPCDGRNEEMPFINGINEERAEELFNERVSGVQKTIHLYVGVPLTQNQYDALVSFTYNVGDGRFISSDVLEYLNQGEYELAGKEMEQFHFAEYEDIETGEKVLKTYQGLIERRKKEAQLFLGGN